MSKKLKRPMVLWARDGGQEDGDWYAVSGFIGLCLSSTAIARNYAEDSLDITARCVRGNIDNSLYRVLPWGQYPQGKILQKYARIFRDEGVAGCGQASCE